MGGLTIGEKQSDMFKITTGQQITFQKTNQDTSWV